MLKGSSSDLVKEKILVALFVSVQFFNILDYVVLMPLGPTLMRYFSITPLQFSTLASSYSISAGVFGVLYSAFADKYNRKHLLFITFAGFTFMTFLCAIAPTYNTLLVARIITGVFGGVLTPIIYAIIADLIPFKRRGKAIGAVMSSFSFTSIIGIPTGLLIADMFSWRHTFYFITIGSLLVMVCIYFILPSIPLPKVVRSPKEIFQNLWRVSVSKDYFNSFFIMSLFTFSGFILFPFLSPYAVQNIGLSESDLKYIYLMGGIFTVFSSKMAGSLTDTFGALKVYFPAAFLAIPFIFLYTSVGIIPLYQLLIISTFFMILINVRMVPVMTLITETPNEADRGAFMGVLMSLRSFAMAAGTSFTGFVVIENTQGRLERFDYIGMFSILLSIFGMYLVVKLNKRIMRKKRHEHSLG